jgi:WD40 repeat protein
MSMSRSWWRLGWRLRHADRTFLLAALGCVIAAAGVKGLSLGGVSVAAIGSGWAQALIACLGGLLAVASLMLGEPPPPRVVDPGQPVRGFLGRGRELPDRFVARPEMLEKAVTALLEAQGQPVALWGWGGAGKTVLATAVAVDRRIQRRFQDGVAWLQTGQHPDAKELLARLAKLLGGREAAYRTVEEGQDELTRLLAKRDVLVVLDDVWQREAIDALRLPATGCQLLVTTRSNAIAAATGAQPVEIAELTLLQALALLGRWTGQDVGGLPTIADAICVRLECLALGVAMAGAMIGRDAPQQRWQDVHTRLADADLGKIAADFGEDYPHPTLLAAIQLSIDDLPGAVDQERYQELAVFAGSSFPRSAAQALWAPAGLSNADIGDLLALFTGRSLLHHDGADWYSLHDLQADVLVRQLGQERLYQVHVDLVDGYARRCPAGWSSGPRDGYFLERLAAHLAAAGRTSELRALLVDFGWLHAKLTDAGLISLLADYPLLLDDAATRQVSVALQLSAHRLVDDPAGLPGQLRGRLANADHPALRHLLTDAARWNGAWWLDPVLPAPSPPLISAGGPLRQTILGHTNSVKTVAVTPDGSRIISAGGDPLGGDYRVRVWELASGRELATLTGHTSLVTALAVTPDGSRIISAGNDHTVRVWNLASGRELAAFTAPVSALAVSPDGSRIISNGNDHTVRVWNLASGRELATLTGHTGPVNAVAVTPDSSRIISSGDDQTVRVWELASGRELATLTGHTARTGHTATVSALAVTPDGSRIVSGGDNTDRTVRVWELASGRELATLTGHTDSVTSVAVTPDGSYVVSGGDDQTVRVWELTSGHKLAALTGHTGWVDAVAVTPDGSRIVSGGGLGDCMVRVWELASGRELAAFTGHTGPVRAVAVTPDSSRIISSGDDQTVRVWELASGRELATLTGHTGRVLTVAVTPDGGRIVSGGSRGDCTVRVWELASGRELATLTGHTDSVNAVAVTPDGSHIISGGLDRMVRIWELASGRELATLTGHTGWVNAVAVTSDGSRVISAGGDPLTRDYTVRVWELASGRELATLAGHTDSVTAVAVTADGSHVISAGEDHTVRVWELASGCELARWYGDAPVNACATTSRASVTIVVGDIRGAVYALQLRGPTPDPALPSTHRAPTPASGRAPMF